LFGKLGCGRCSKSTPACCSLEGSERARTRKYVARAHRLFGWITILLAFGTLFFGIWAFSCEVECQVVSEITYALFGYMAVLLVPLFCLEARHRKLKRHIRIQVPLTPHASIEGMLPVFAHVDASASERLIGERAD